MVPVMKKLTLILALSAMALLPLNLKAQEPSSLERDTLFQVSTINALLQGAYDGYVSIDELKSHGDFGLGTFHGLNGEMVVLDGQVWQVTADGAVHKAQGDWLTPFAAVTPFEQDLNFELGPVDSFQALCQAIQAHLPDENLFYAVRVHAEFSYMKTRSVPEQTKPYPPLSEVAKHQPEFEMHDVQGELVGFVCPEYAAKWNVPGFHLHFLDKDHVKGGHVLDLKSAALKVSVDVTPTFLAHLPEPGGLENVDMGRDMEQELKDVEQ